MTEHHLNNLIKTTMESLCTMVDADTIVGKPITSLDGTTIIPISKVSFGFITGGTDFNLAYCSNDNPDLPFGGGSGAGVTLNPVSFIVVKDDTVRFLNVESDNPYEKLAEIVPDIIDTVKDLLSPEDEDSKNDSDKKKDKKEDTNKHENNHGNNAPVNKISLFNC